MVHVILIIVNSLFELLVIFLNYSVKFFFLLFYTFHFIITTFAILNQISGYQPPLGLP